MLAPLLALAVVSAAPDVHPKSVYRVSAAVDAPVLVVAAAAGIVPPLFDNQLIHPRCPCDVAEVPRIDRGVIGLRSHGARVASDVTVWLALLAPVVLDAIDVGFTWPLFEDMVVYLQVVAVNNALVNLGKYTVQRPRPFVYAGIDPAEAAKPDAYTSFWSGHSSNTVAALVAASMTYTLRHGPTWWPWLITAVVGASVAAERMLAGQHFPTDVLMGAAVGAGVGWLLPWLHSRARLNVTVTPIPQGAAIVWTGAL